MAEASRPISVRLATREVERLQARAHVICGSLAGVARELIITGLAGGDNKALADRLMMIERRLAALEGLARDFLETSARTETKIDDLRAKFDALLNALSSGAGETQ